jgi:Alpha/beta hydrolase of unknown function (DUF900)
MSLPSFYIQKILLSSPEHPITLGRARAERIRGIPCYFVTSTAPANVEETLDFDPRHWYDAKSGIDEIASDLYRQYCDSSLKDPPEIIVTIHGYNTPENSVVAWYSDITRYLNQIDPVLRQKRNLVFIGYRWSSEQVSLFPKNIFKNFKALPLAPKHILSFGSFTSIAWFMAIGFANKTWLDILIAGLLALSTSLTAMIVALFLLRMTVYFRDIYRATNFGVLDFVEFIRALDKALINQTAIRIRRTESDTPDIPQAARDYWCKTQRKVKLNFIGHSMGALVVTNLVRILSDVFTQASINQHPSGDIGNTLSLGRLILVAPDIPLLSIISNRSNFLAASLRRFDEAYLFSSEGDLALRLASTAANYISFPSATRDRGHRLGNVALTARTGYGICNLAALRQYFKPGVSFKQAMIDNPDHILQNLYVTQSGNARNGYGSLAYLFSQQTSNQLNATQTPHATLADLFTFFDCTDYYDTCLCFEGNTKKSHKKIGLLTRAKRKTSLNLGDYIALIIDAMLGRRDGHGGYFQGQFSRELIYRIACLGFEGTLKNLTTTTTDLPAPVNLPGAESGARSGAGSAAPSVSSSPEAALDQFNDICNHLGIQVYLSPLRYRVDIQGNSLGGEKAELLQIIQIG